MKTKKFCPKLLEENDTKYRDVVKAYLLSQGYKVKDNEDKYGQDLEAYFYVEFEKRSCWTEDKFPYDTVHIPFRKQKFLFSNCMYFVLSADGKRGMFCSNKDILMSPVATISNKYVKKGELFYNVPLDKFEVVELPNL